MQQPNNSIAIAKAAWGQNPPQWVMQIATACTASSQSAVGAKIGYSNGTISQVLAKKYPGNYQNVQQKVEQYLSGNGIQCPTAGNIQKPQCTAYQRQPYNASNPAKVVQYKACRSGCPHADKIKATDSRI